MDPLETATATAPGITTITSLYMLDGATYQSGAEAGFSGLDFYVTGRGGPLGEVDADVVTAAFAWFEPGHVRTNWEAGCRVTPPARAALLWAEALHRWGEANVPGDLDAARLAELAGRVVDAASVSGAPLFAGWRALPRPDAPAALAVHHLNGLRELRGALHAGAVLATGLRPLEAVLVRQPHMAAIFGWPEPYPEVAGLDERWAEAEAGTDRAMAPAFGGAALEPGERAELAELVGALHAATSA